LYLKLDIQTVINNCYLPGSGGGARMPWRSTAILGCPGAVTQLFKAFLLAAIDKLALTARVWPFRRMHIIVFTGL
jgi:hypothetical protein